MQTCVVQKWTVLLLLLIFSTFQGHRVLSHLGTSILCLECSPLPTSAHVAGSFYPSSLRLHVVSSETLPLTILLLSLMAPFMFLKRFTVSEPDHESELHLLAHLQTSSFQMILSPLPLSSSCSATDQLYPQLAHLTIPFPMSTYSQRYLC